VPMAVAAPNESLSYPLKLPKLVIREFRQECFDAEPAQMWLRKTLRVVVETPVSYSRRAAILLSFLRPGHGETA
jgi:hypothetical protein